MLNNRRRPLNRRSKPSHILNVKARSGKLTARKLGRALSWGGGLLLLVLVIGGAYYGIQTGLKSFLFENPNYNLTNIDYASDGPLKREAALQIAGIQAGVNVFSIKLGEAREKLEALPQVTQVELQRVLPNQITLRVVERKPVAWVAEKNSESQGAGEHALLIDTNGVLLKPAELLSEYLRLPTIFGVSTAGLAAGQTLNVPELRAALDLLSVGNEMAPVEIRSVDLSKGYCMLVTTSSRTQVTFGLERITEQMERLAKYLRYCEENRRELQTVNLMVKRNVPVTFMPLDQKAQESQPDPEPKVLKAEKPHVARAIPVTPKPKISKKTPEVRKALPVDSSNRVKNG